MTTKTLSHGFVALLLATSSSIAIAAAPAENAAAKEGADDRHGDDISTIIVTGQRAAPRTASDAAPITVEVLDGTRLERERAPSLGETISRMAGVQNSYFGPAVGQPEIRGQSGSRVVILNDGIATRDASSISGSFPAAIEPFLVDRIEVIKGPGAILYGGEAIGGAVNVVDGRIPDRRPAKSFSTRLEVSGGVNAPVAALARLDGSVGNFVWHVDGLYRTISGYRVPGFAKSDGCRSWKALADDSVLRDICQLKIMGPDWKWNPATKKYDNVTPPERQKVLDPYPGEKHELANSSLDTAMLTAGGSYVGDRGYIGASVSHYDNRYGVPGFRYVTETFRDPTPIMLKAQQTRYDIKGSWNPGWPGGLDTIMLHAAHVDGTAGETIRPAVKSGGGHGHDHDGHAPAKPDEKGQFDRGSVLKSQANDLRLEITHKPFGPFTGALGGQYGHARVKPTGPDRYLPEVATENVGLFLVEKGVLGPVTVDAGVRWDRVDYTIDKTTIPEGRGLGGYAKDRRFETFNAALGAKLYLASPFYVQARYAHAERAPSLMQLYAHGSHFATLTDEEGDAKLEIEKAEHVELGFGIDTRPFTLSANAYRTRYKNYIYLGNTGVSRVMPVREWRQGDTDFEGLEADARLRFSALGDTRWELHAFGDLITNTPQFTMPAGYSPFKSDVKRTPEWDREYYRKSLDGDYLPRSPVSRVGGDVGFATGPWRGSVGAVHHMKQTELSKRELASPAYTLVDAHLAYRWLINERTLDLFVDAANLTNAEARPHNSFLRHRAPLPGRSISVGVRIGW